MPRKISRALVTNDSSEGGAEAPAKAPKIVPSIQSTTNPACRTGSDDPAAANISTAARRITAPPESYCSRNSGRRVASNANSYRANIRARPEVTASNA